MNYEGIGVNFARIQNKHSTRAIRKADTTPICMASFEQRGDIEYPITDVHVHRDEIVQHMPYQDMSSGQTRQVLYISGQSGSGKSYYLGRYMNEYRRMFKKNPIYIFSHVSEDAVLDEIRGVNRIIFDDTFINREWKADDFADSMVIFDDILELTKSKQLMEVLTHIRSLILTTGRHHSTFYCETSHVTNAGHATKLILTESTSVTLYPHSTGARTLKYALQTAFGFDKKDIEKIQSLPSRWVTILKSAPRVVMYEGGCYTI